MNIFKKNMLYIIKNKNINIYIYIIVNIYCMCVYLCIHNEYTQYTYIYYVNKKFILDVINRMTTLPVSQTCKVNLQHHLGQGIGGNPNTVIN